MPYNIISCTGWETTATGYFTGGACLMSRLGIVILFFIIAIIRKWGGEEIGMNFSFILGLLGGLGSYLAIVIIFGTFKVGLLVGIIAALVFGYGGGMFLGGEE